MLHLRGEIDAKHGPLIQVCIRMDPVLAHACVRAGRPVPEPVLGYALIDTGAGESGIDEDTAVALQLNPVGVAELHTPAGNAMKVGVFWGEVGFLDSPFPPMRKQFLGMHLGYAVRDAKVIAILGRDFLAGGVLTYDGGTGRYRLEFSDVAERTDTFEGRHAMAAAMFR
jgi:hypothetical protein